MVNALIADNKSHAFCKTVWQLIIAMRPQQWLKNFFVFAALIFARNFFDYEKVLLSVVAFFIFCFVSGAVYIVNDICDLVKDRGHIHKKNRPLASGKLRISTAKTAAILLIFAGIVASFKINYLFGWSIFGFIGLNLLYSFILKKILIVDIISIALGFVIRVIAGALIIQVIISPWLIFCSFFLALFLAINKRRSGILQADTTALPSVGYSIQLLDQMNLVVLPTILIGYSLYTFSSVHSRLMMATVPMVFYGLCRYLYIVNAKKIIDDGPSDDLLRDRPLQFVILLWIIASTAIVFYEK